MIRNTRNFVLALAVAFTGVTLADENCDSCIAAAKAAGGGTEAAPAHNHPPMGPESATGTLTIRTTQGTAGAPSLEGERAMVHFYQASNVVKHAEGRVDAEGKVVITDVPLTRQPVQPLVMMPYGQVTYQMLGPVMHSGKTEADVGIVVYESTNETPEWRIPMRHLILSRTEQGVRVLEMLAVDNRSDKTWVGTGDHEGATLIVRLPEGAGHMEYGDGFDEEAVHIHDNALMNIAPMTPGMTSYQFAYTLPVKGGKVNIPVRSPAVTQHLMIFVPDDGSIVAATGLTDGGAQPTEDGRVMRRYSTVGLPAGQAATLVISGLSSSSASAWSMPQIIGAVGLGVVLLGGAAFVLLKPTGGRPEAG